MISLKLKILVLLLVFFATGLAEQLNHHVNINRNRRENNEEDLQGLIQVLRRHEYETARDEHSIHALKLRKLFAQHTDDERLLNLREAKTLEKAIPDITIALQNEAATSVRLVIFYIRPNSRPHVNDTDLLLMHQNKSISIPSDAIYLEVIIEKYGVDGKWHISYTDQMDEITDLCLVISGNALKSQVYRCEQKA